MILKVCVLGLGRIGLPTALVVAERGHEVVGVDIDQEIVQRLSMGMPPFYEPGLEAILKTAGKRFRPTTNMQNAVENSEVILVCVGTRRFADKKPDLRVIEKLVEELGKCPIRNRLVVFKTTFPVGTTRRLASDLERITGLRCETDFFAAFCPERMVEGNAVAEVGTLPKVVGGIGPKSLEKAVEFYRTIGGTVVPVSSTDAAETVKLLDNAYRITKFAFANEVSLLAEENGLDAYEVIAAANKDYARNDIPTPSCGVGGFCLTKDPWYLEEAFRRTTTDRRFHSLWLYARKVNDYQVIWTADRVELALNGKNVSLKESHVLICGATYKANIDDIRDSHAIFLAEELQRRGASVSFWDPHVTQDQIHSFTLHHNAEEAFSGKDVAIFAVKHREFEQLGDRMRKLLGLMRTRVIFDGASVFGTNIHPESTFLRTGVRSDS